jgi:uncharacterized protein (UPF0333 family)
MSIPNKEDDLALWMTSFRDGISLDVGKFFVTEGDSDTISAAVNAFLAARNIANNPATRTVQTVDQKNAQRVNAEGVCRTFYGLIQRNNGISNDDKIAIGVTPLGTERTPRPCPQASPTISVVASTPGAITLEYRDSVGNNTKAKPFGATMCQLFVVVADDNVSTMENARFVGNFSNNPMAAVFDLAERGKQATFFARWGGKRNEFGQWSVPASMTIAA